MGAEGPSNVKVPNPVFVRDNDGSGDYSLKDVVLIPKKGGGHDSVSVQEFLSSSRFELYGSSPQDRLSYITSNKIYERSQRLKGQTSFTGPQAEVSEELKDYVDALKEKATLMNIAEEESVSSAIEARETGDESISEKKEIPDFGPSKPSSPYKAYFGSGKTPISMFGALPESLKNRQQNSGLSPEERKHRLDTETRVVKLGKGETADSFIAKFVEGSNGVWSHEEVMELNQLMGNNPAGSGLVILPESMRNLATALKESK